MSRSSIFASALLANPTLPGGLVAVKSWASNSRPFLPQQVESIYTFTFHQQNVRHVGQDGTYPGACLSTAAGDSTASSLDSTFASGQNPDSCAGPPCPHGDLMDTNATLAASLDPTPIPGRPLAASAPRRFANRWELSRRSFLQTGPASATAGHGNVGSASQTTTGCGCVGLSGTPGIACSPADPDPRTCNGDSSSEGSTPRGSLSSCSHSSGMQFAWARPKLSNRGSMFRNVINSLNPTVAPTLPVPPAAVVGTAPLSCSLFASFSSQVAVRASGVTHTRQSQPAPLSLSLPSDSAPSASLLRSKTRGRRAEDPAAAATASSADDTIQTSTISHRRPKKAPLPAFSSAAASAIPSVLEPAPMPASAPVLASSSASTSPSSAFLADPAGIGPTPKATGASVNEQLDKNAFNSATLQPQGTPAVGEASNIDEGVLEKGYVYFPDTGEAYCSSSGFMGDVQHWHQRHVDEILSVPARGPGVPIPPLEQFKRQIDLEVQSRHLVLEEYRRTLDKQKARGALDESIGVWRLMADWLPKLTAQIENHIQQFLDLEGSWRSINDFPGRVKASKAARARARTVGSASADQAVKKLEWQCSKESNEAAVGDGVSASGSTGGGSAASAVVSSGSTSSSDVRDVVVIKRDLVAAAADPLMAELREWVPYVLPVPPQVLARTVLCGLLNLTGLRSYENTLELPHGMIRSVDMAEHIGERLVHTVSYMKICEAIARRRKELFAERRILRSAQSEATKLGLRNSPGKEAEEVGKKSELVIQVAGAKESGSVVGSSGLGDDDERCSLDSQILQAAARVGAARKALQDMKAAAAVIQPRGASRELAGRSAVKAGDRGRKNISRARQLNSLAAHVPGLAMGMSEWTLERRVKVGASLIALALASIRVRLADSGTEEPAFSHSTNALMTFERGGYQTPGLIVCHPQVLRMLEGDEELRRMLQPRVMPMLVEPRPWSKFRGGGLLTTTVSIVKTRDSPMLRSRLHEAHREGRMGHLYEALNVLGNVPWRINARLFDVMEQVVNQGGGQLGIPCITNHEMPLRFTTGLNDCFRAYLGVDTPEQCGTPYLRLQREGRRRGQLLVGSGAMSFAEESAYQKQCDEIRMTNRNEMGQRTMMKYRLETARQLAGAYSMYGRSTGSGANGNGGRGGHGLNQLSQDLMLPSFNVSGSEPTVFFQPHNVDFRGRAYPLHPFLNHTGEDSTRALLQFGVGKPLGQQGFKWLLLQMSSLWGRGVDKLPLAQRLSWAEEKLPTARACAATPLAVGWWREGERPWQLLASCFEVAAALDSGNPASYVSHHPVSQDGTCNGLQHYAALARDSDCGAAVNLLPADRPQDVYQAVANVVADRVERDCKRGRSEATKAYGSVDRKLVKQTVMTYVYGVTLVGAREQIENRLEERGWTNACQRRKVGTYIARIIFESMGEVFGPVVSVRTWLDDCAKHVVSAGQPVCWTSPMGFPIVQPYRKLRTYQVSTPLQKITLRDYSGEEDAPVDVRRQRAGFPPNYIHSLDGAHMMMTALGVRKAGGVFAAVHDSFWTHASTVDQMNRILRDTFVELHSRPLLQELRDEIEANPLYRSAQLPLPPLPRLGGLRLEAVRDSTYFFS